MTVYKNDNTGAFGNTLITITLSNPQSYTISKAVFQCGCISKSFSNPTFPLEINFTPEETSQLNYKSTCYLAVWDSQGRKKTCEGSLTFDVKNEEVNG